MYITRTHTHTQLCTHAYIYTHVYILCRFALYPKCFEKIAQFIPNKVSHGVLPIRYTSPSTDHRPQLTAYNSIICQRRRKTTRSWFVR